MLVGIEVVLALAAIGAAITMIVIGLRRRTVAVARPNVDPSDDNVIATNIYCLAIVGLLFFSGSFLASLMM